MNARSRLFLGLWCGALIAGAARPASTAAPEKLKLSLRAAPSRGTPSTVFVFQALLTGGEDNEGLYCLSTEWAWEEQADASINESECPPFKAGETRVERSFSEEQSFRRTGTHVVRVVLRKGDKELASASTSVVVWQAR
jgi:hypothetical protein